MAPKSIRNVSIDLAPLKKYPDFRNLWASGLVSYLGSMITYVAIPFQIKNMTHSYIAVALSGAIELAPLIIFGLYGGLLADAVDRKRMMWATEAALMVLTGVLLANSLQGRPSLILIYVVTGLFAAVDGLQRPSAGAILPRIVGHEDLPAASALMSLRYQFGLIVGPTMGGLIIATYSVTAGFAVDICTFAISLFFLSRVGSVPSPETHDKPSLASLF